MGLTNSSVSNGICSGYSFGCIQQGYQLETVFSGDIGLAGDIMPKMDLFTCTLSLFEWLEQLGGCLAISLILFLCCLSSRIGGSFFLAAKKSNREKLEIADKGWPQNVQRLSTEFCGRIPIHQGRFKRTGTYP